jgi:hypothetical protein
MSDLSALTDLSAPKSDKPLRGELLSADRLAEEARRIASGQTWVIEKRLRTTPLIPLVHHAAAGLAADTENGTGRQKDWGSAGECSSTTTT